jgi:GNAT-family acetyltransferase (TIGR03103 family)
MPRRRALKHRIDQSAAASVRSWERPTAPAARGMKSNAVLHMGWGRLIFAHTFERHDEIAHLLRNEKPGERDVAFYLRDPHVGVSLAPQELFLDPSHTFRLWLSQYRIPRTRPQGVLIRRIQTQADVKAINHIYAARNMVQADEDYLWSHRRSRVLLYIVAQDQETGQLLGVCAGVDHQAFFHDPEQGSSLWSLAVDPQATRPGVGESLVRFLAEHYHALGRAYMDLSVMHNNNEAVRLYKKIGFKRVPVFCLKHKNIINEALYTSPAPSEEMNPYADIIIREARKRGIAVDILDANNAYFSLSFGGRSILCRESLTELTSAVAMSLCDNKAMTLRLLTKQGLRVPAQCQAAEPETYGPFLEKYKRVVVKPARGEQGQGISVDVSEPEAIKKAVAFARQFCEQIIIEEMVDGQDLRIIVIDFEVVAAAVRKPPVIRGSGEHTIEKLIEKQSRRRAAATGGESRIPLDDETRRCVEAAGYSLQDILPLDETLVVRKAANLHTGGTIHDVTDALHPALRRAAVDAARALNIPVVGLDFLVPSVEGSDYVIIEANERPGLANHEPQPTAERFIDLLFPLSRVL